MAVAEEPRLRRESYPEQAERIEKELAEVIERIHSRVDSIPTAHIREVLAEKSSDRAKRAYEQIGKLSKDVVQFAQLFRSTPPNYYLEIEVAHSAHSAYSEDKSYPFSIKEKIGNTLRYYVDCGIWINNGQERSVVALREQIPPINSRFPLPYFILKQTGTEAAGDKYLKPGEIQNARVVRKPGTFVPLISLNQLPK